MTKARSLERRRPRVARLALAALLALGACSGESEPRGAAPPAPAPIEGLPVTLRVKQRSTTPVPRGNGIALTVGDVTRGQVDASIRGAEGESLLAPTSLREGERAGFAIGAHRFTLRLVRIDGALLGQDHAVFELLAAAPGLTERDKIEKLLAAMAALEDATFLRNGEEHDAAAAVAHLRRKLDHAGDVSARTFVDEVASRSSLSGDPYEIRLADGSIVRAGAWLRARLEEIEARDRAAMAASGGAAR